MMKLLLTCCLVSLADGSSDIRIVDAKGATSSVGLLQIRTGDAFGSVCRILNEGAATVACRSMGYSQGSAGSVDCAGYGGENLCGANGSPVAVQDLSCTGDELSLNECTWSKPESDCSSHAQDAVVFCSSGQVLPSEGSLRLLAADGAPASTGRLEVFYRGSWGSVCSAGFSAEQVACKQMGFTSSKKWVSTCAAAGVGFCGSEPPRVGLLACTGNEQSVFACSYEEGDDVFCAANEAVVLACTGAGDAQGRVGKSPAPQQNL
jgi:hypothetical protein